MYIKNGQIESGYLLKKEDETIVLNAPKEAWLAEGWEEYEEVPTINSPKNLQMLKEETLRECENYYNNIVLQVQFNQQFVWVPLELRAAYRDILDDLKAAGETTVSWKDKDIQIDKALTYLRRVNVYEYQCKKVYDTHVKNIIRMENAEDVESYDYTVDYPFNLTL